MKNGFLKVCLTVGIPASGKSSWAKAEIAKDPLNYVRVNGDSLREMCNGSVYSQDYEKIIIEARNYFIRDALKRNLNVIVDNLNLSPRHFKEICAISKASGRNVQVYEKHFYVELDEAIERDSKREGKACVGRQVIEKWWKDSGKSGFKHYHPKTEIFKANDAFQDSQTIEQDDTLPKAIMVDLDGSIANIAHRSPYNTAECFNDAPVSHVVEMVKLFYNNDYKIIFCSGREDKFEDLTCKWLDKHVGIKYDLFMRPTGNFDKDSVIKENIYNEKIKSKYYVRAVIDDRLSVCQLWHRLSLPIFRVGNPDATF